MSMDEWPRNSKRIQVRKQARARAAQLEKTIGVIEYYRMLERVKKH